MPSACSALSYFTAAAQYEPQRGMPKNLILSSRTTFATKARDGYCRTASLAASASLKVFWASSRAFWASAKVACAPSKAFSASARPSGSALHRLSTTTTFVNFSTVFVISTIFLVIPLLLLITIMILIIIA